MSLGDVLHLTAPQVADLEALVRRLLQANCSIREVRRVTGGANALHFALLSADGSAFGLKAVTRGIVEGVLNEQTVSELGHLLEAPNCCAVRVGQPPPSFDPLKGHMVACSRWLYPSRKLSDFQAGDIAMLQAMESCVGQIGEWVAFGVIFGIDDRHLGNWVADLGEAKVAMIDNEAAFGDPGLSVYRPIIELAVGIAPLKTQKKDHPTGRHLGVVPVSLHT